ncbi:hypothetical protein [Rhodohalobacter mucosus]|uniref:Long-chain fatty acid transport protein n=1 Tax=Rhodohalobacter mucosus TaxID=2079485 RepID=A0A316TU77_9BACT|nr:hypothetical protein [Rhodohalobacter mucosus]PWN06585.1 hypothetical protein DDZ15_08695 [Rhodohalobacter mucosus]
MKKILIIALLLVTQKGLLLAQTGGYAGEFTRMGFSPRGMAMGNAMTAVTLPGSYAYYNPALAAMPGEDIQIDISTAALQFDRQLHSAAIRLPLPPTAGLSFTLLNARVRDIDGRTTDGYHSGMLNTAEYQLTGSFAVRFSKKVWAGVGIKYNHAVYHQQIPASTGIGIDAGLLIHLSSRLQAALAIRDLLGSVNIDSSELYGTDQALDRDQPFPVRSVVGLSWQVTDRWLLSQDTELRFQSSTRITDEISNQNGFEVPVTRRDEQTSRSLFLRAGSQYQIHDRFTLRSGLELLDAGSENRIQPSFGFSVHLPFDRYSPAIDYAFRREPGGFSTMHVFAIRLDI